ncbi:hypothetical protein [Nocardioides limicola]|uniref:hypothetical protein n=1 Tax=Nocardioides limicola TaxID=2803368 RepID=UPI00193B8153|nr:hypothetical protein [Nocardioides sp. DJM-14]
MRRLRAGLAVALLAALLGGCVGDPQASYCRAVERNQAALGEIVGTGARDALLQALPHFDDLASRAPRDIAEDWREVTRAVTRLQNAFDAAEVDPATFDPMSPPEDLSEEALLRIQRAAADLDRPVTRTALARVEQHALDVCGTPLGL